MVWLKASNAGSLYCCQQIDQSLILPLRANLLGFPNIKIDLKCNVDHTSLDETVCEYGTVIFTRWCISSIWWVKDCSTGQLANNYSKQQVGKKNNVFSLVALPFSEGKITKHKTQHKWEWAVHFNGKKTWYENCPISAQNGNIGKIGICFSAPSISVVWSFCCNVLLL